MKKDSITQIIVVILAVCFVCSIAVSMAAVLLRDKQLVNSELARKRNILTAANVIDPATASSSQVETLFSQAELRLVDLEQGKFIDEARVLSPGTFDQRKAESDPQLSDALSGGDDIASIGRREKYSLIYYINSDSGQTVVFPIRGYGLWSTLRGYLALDAKDYNTIVGITFYEHAETPGLGGEVDNAEWKEQWRGKKLFYNDGSPGIRLAKGGGDASSGATGGEDFQVDALSGATITSNGVNNLINFWFGDLGFGTFIKNVREV